MNTLAVRFAALVAAAVITAAAVSAQAPSLYKRLGGYDAIAAVVDDFVPRVATDPQLGKFFAGAGKDTQAHIRQLAVDFICNATGGPCLYIGRSLKTAHAGLGITESDWEVAMKHLVATLDKLKVARPEKDDVLAAIGGLKGDIVDKRGS